MKSLRRKAIANSEGIIYFKWKGTCAFKYGSGTTYWNSRLNDYEFMGRIRHYSRLLNKKNKK